MKKVLLASTAVMLSAGVAAAEVKIGGTARAGIVFNDAVGEGASETRVNMRLRFNFDVAKELDSGVTLGGRIRMQYDAGRTQDDSGEGGAEINAAYLYASAGGLRVEVGNSNTAYDASALLYNAELGYVSVTQGGYNLSSYTAFQTSPFSAAQANRMGLYAAYSIGDFTGRISYITPNQNVTDLGTGVKEELSISANYKFGGFTIAGAYAQNGNFIDDNNIAFLGGEYAFNDQLKIGLQLFDHGKTAGGADKGTSITLYGRYVLAGGLGLGAFISNASNEAQDTNGLTEENAFGIGFDYDLGGATLAGTIQKTHTDDTYADLGIRFSF
jgi:outer membrane protein OmpU